MIQIKLLVIFLLSNAIHSLEHNATNVTVENLIESLLKKNNSALFDVVSVKSRLVYVWIKCENEPHNIILKSSEIRFPRCEIPITHDYGCGRGLATAALGNGKVLVWMKDHEEEKACWRVYFVDPDTCGYDSYRLDVYSDQPVDNVLGYETHFDVFFAKGPLCADKKVCGMRFNDKGVNTKNFTVPHDGGRRYWLESVKIGQTNAYFYASTSRDNKSVVLLFDPNFKELHKFHFNRSIDGYSVTHGKISLCNVERDQKSIYCEMHEPYPKESKLYRDLHAVIKDDKKTMKVFNLSYLGLVSKMHLIFNDRKVKSMEVFNLPNDNIVVIIVTDDYSFSNFVKYNKLTPARVTDLEQYIHFGSSRVKHLYVGNGTDCVISWSSNSSKVVTKCLERIKDDYTTHTFEIN